MIESWMLHCGLQITRIGSLGMAHSAGRRLQQSARCQLSPDETWRGLSVAMKKSPLVARSRSPLVAR
jgi:hypothetical protein